ncbi:MAG: hypothetical protein NTX61_07265 [Bacteroidetes bacterium]|nr:hypothetical protein [Bacteroidota bacterium]
MENIFSIYPWFTPSPGTLNLWLFTRKSKSLYNPGDTFPGLFQTLGFRRDATIFFIGIIFEIIGLSLFYLFFRSIYFSVLFFFLSFILVAGSHWNRGRITILKTQIALLKHSDYLQFTPVLNPIPLKISWRKKRLARLNFYRFCFYFMIIFLALFKTYGFIMGIASFSSGIYVIVLTTIISLFFLIVALIHIFVTGYFLSEVMFRYHLKKEIQGHLKLRLFCNPGISSNPPQPYLQVIIPNPNNLTFPKVSTFMINNTQQVIHPKFGRAHIQSGFHRLEYNTLSTLGIFTDKQKIEMASQIFDPDPAIQKIKQDAFIGMATYYQLTTLLYVCPISISESIPSPLPIIPDPPVPRAPVSE